MKQEEESYVEAMLGDMRRLRDEISCLVRLLASSPCRFLPSSPPRFLLRA